MLRVAPINRAMGNVAPIWRSSVTCTLVRSDRSMLIPLEAATLRHILSTLLIVTGLLVIFPIQTFGDSRPNFEEIRSLHQVEKLAHHTPWNKSERAGDIVFFLFDDARQIRRYDLGQRRWLETLSFDEEPTYFTTNEEYLIVSFDRRTVRFDHDGGNEQHLRNTNYAPRAMFAAGAHLYIMDAWDVISIEIDTGDLVDVGDNVSIGREVAAARGRGLAFSRGSGSPSDIQALEFFPDGTIGIYWDSPYHGTYPGATHLWVFPNERWVVDDAGIVYSTADLTYTATFDGRLTDVTFFGNIPIVLRNDRLISYSNSFLRTGEIVVDETLLEIEVSGSDVVGFMEAGSEIETVVYPIDSFAPSVIETAVDPRGLVIEPDDYEIDGRSTIYLLDSKFHNVYRYSVTQRDYLETIVLRDTSSFIAYSETADALFVGYTWGEISRIQFQPDGTPGTETFFALVPGHDQRNVGLYGLAVAGEYVFVSDSWSSWPSHHTFAPDGSVVSSVDLRPRALEFVWSDANRKIYCNAGSFVAPTGWSLVGDLSWVDIDQGGVVGDWQDSPYHTDARMWYPLRVRPDGDRVLTGDGRIFDALTLEQIAMLPNKVIDAAWIEGSLTSIHSLDEASELQSWDQDYDLVTNRALEGEAMLLAAASGELVAGVLWKGKPVFSVWSPELVGGGLSVRITDQSDLVRSGDRLTFTIEVDNLGSIRETGVLVTAELPEILRCGHWLCDATDGSSCGAREGSGSLADAATILPGGRITYLLKTHAGIGITGLARVTATAESRTGPPIHDTDLTQIETGPPSPVETLPCDQTGWIW